MSVGQYVEDGRIVDDREESHGRNDLFQNVTNLGLNLGFRLGWWPKNMVNARIYGACRRTALQRPQEVRRG